MTRVLPTTTPEERDAAVDAVGFAISRGQLVVIPTDTVYGVAADAFDPGAVRRLLQAKGRGREMPPPVLIAQTHTLQALATDLPDYVRGLVERFWPGPLTIVAHEQSTLRWDLGETKGTVAVRVPADDVARAILDRTGPLAVSSANTTGDPAATTASEAERMLGESVEVVVDGGPALGAVASTILDVTGDRPRLLRAGALSVSELNEALAGSGVTVDEG